MSDLDKFNYECEGQISLFDSEETAIDKITTEMAKYICDNLCRFPREMGQFICDILNEYNRINDFEQTQSCKLLQKVAELEKRLKAEVMP